MSGKKNVLTEVLSVFFFVVLLVTGSHTIAQADLEVEYSCLSFSNADYNESPCPHDNILKKKKSYN